MDRPRPKRVLIIGGGVSGIITLRNLALYAELDEVKLVERRSDIGGVWFLELQSPGQPLPHWQSPAYPELIGNVLPEFLSFSSHPPFPNTSSPEQPFPSLQETYSYLKEFAAPYVADGRIQCNEEVERVEEKLDGRWQVTLRDVTSEHQKTENWDAVVIATGWHSNPWWPSTEGLDKLRERGLAIHAKDWMGVESKHKGKRVLVLGNAASGNDIAAQLADVAPSPGYVYRSIRRPAFPGFPSLPDNKIHDVKAVQKYTMEDGKITAFLVDGSSITDIDLVVAGTGYRANPDFVYVRSTPNSKSSDELRCLMTDPPPSPYRIPSLHEHIIYAPNPSLAFIGCIMAFTPFTIADLASSWLALAWAQHLKYPETLEARLQWEKDRIETTKNVLQQFSTGDSEPTNYISYNVLGFGEQSYAERLKQEIEGAGEKGKKIAETLPDWNDERTKEREGMYGIKLAALKWEKEQRK
ncbi:hypothetical protein ONZ45_g1113 [Pleurotus djamor]|nr:hypothetical protein ONZ45_g1113 [Pleurotus djamor]